MAPLEIEYGIVVSKQRGSTSSAVEYINREQDLPVIVNPGERKKIVAYPGDPEKPQERLPFFNRPPKITIVAVCDKGDRGGVVYIKDNSFSARGHEEDIVLSHSSVEQRIYLPQHPTRHNQVNWGIKIRHKAAEK